MKIKTRVGLSALVSTGAVLLIGVIIALAFDKIKELEHQSEDHRSLMQAMSELDLLTHEFFIGHDKLAELRWMKKFAALSETFAEMSRHAHASPVELEPMKSKLAELKDLFTRGVFSYERFHAELGGADNGDRGFDTKLMNDVLHISKNLAEYTATIEARVWREMTAYVRKIQALIYSLIGGLVVFLALTTLAFGRSITGPMHRLQEGAQIVGSGDLEHRIDSRATDEFGVLGQSFNEMTERLKTILASRDELEREVQARQRAERGILRLNAELEQRVRQRTQQLEMANHELAAFSYSVSHDLRAPLRSIEGFTRILLEDKAAQLDDEGARHLRRVGSGVQRMTQIIDDLLRLSQIARAQLQPRQIDLSALARTVVGELGALAPERTISWVIAPGMIAVADSGLMRIALENLLRNAWKYTGKHPAARIEFGAETREAQTVYFVRDDGAGFDMACVDKLFGAFQRLHDARDFEGSGIGLTIVQRIIHRHGGRIWAEAAVERGATFFFTLPAIPTETSHSGTHVRGDTGGS